METVAGGTNVDLAEPIGTVFVRQLKVGDFPRLLNLLDDECRSLELYCDKPKGWADTLTMSQHECLLATAERINADFFWPWVKRRVERAERVRPGLTEQLIGSSLANGRAGQRPPAG